MSWSRALLLTVRRMVLPAPQRVSTMAAIAISDMAVASCRPPLLLLVVGKGREGKGGRRSGWRVQHWSRRAENEWTVTVQTARTITKFYTIIDSNKRNCVIQPGIYKVTKMLLGGDDGFSGGLLESVS